MLTTSSWGYMLQHSLPLHGDTCYNIHCLFVGIHVMIPPHGKPEPTGSHASQYYKTAYIVSNSQQTLDSNNLIVRYYFLVATVSSPLLAINSSPVYKKRPDIAPPFIVHGFDLFIFRFSTSQFNISKT
ncbi:hypothetical protein L1887_29916 [Cichorium endivia]|nr:hypothetical protein L1887_29916 [Cichorium endivia]